MIDVTADIDTAAVGRINDMLDRVARESPRRLAAETKRAAIYICQSLRKNTKTAPKRIPRADVRWGRSDPQYITGTKGKAKGKLLRRTVVNRYRNGVKGNIIKWKLLDGDPQTTRATSADLSAAWKRFGSITRHGLAKKSWGWVMKAIYNGAPAGDTSWKRTKGERRDPRQFVRGLFRRTAGGAFAQIHNALDYIFAAVAPGAVDQSVEAAANRLEHNIQRHIERATA